MKRLQEIEDDWTECYASKSWLIDRIYKLTAALEYTIDLYDKAIDDEYSSTDYLEELLAKANPVRRVLKDE
jgi:hypothetical protein